MRLLSHVAEISVGWRQSQGWQCNYTMERTCVRWFATCSSNKRVGFDQIKPVWFIHCDHNLQNIGLLSLSQAITHKATSSRRYKPSHTRQLHRAVTSHHTQGNYIACIQDHSNLQQKSHSVLQQKASHRRDKPHGTSMKLDVLIMISLSLICGAQSDDKKCTLCSNCSQLLGI
jgi:hypothetical protein